MKKYILYCITVLIFLYGCGNETSSLPAGPNTNSKSENNSPKVLPLIENISLKDRRTAALAYNPASNSLTLFEKNKNIYSAYMLQPDNTWSESPIQWTVKNKQFLDNFTYGPSGLLYACLKCYNKKGHLRTQTFVQLTGSGKIKTVPLQKLNPAGKKCSVQDICFCGTALAITYADHSVKFYNIAEGQAFGCDDIKGEPGRNSFYDYHYIRADSDNSKRKFLLKNYDIRSGELSHTIFLSEQKNTTAPYYIASYRERLYLLSADGIFCGNNTENSLTKKIELSALGIDSTEKIKYFEAARDDVLYIAYKDQKATLQLSRFPANRS